MDDNKDNKLGWLPSNVKEAVEEHRREAASEREQGEHAITKEATDNRCPHISDADNRSPLDTSNEGKGAGIDRK